MKKRLLAIIISLSIVLSFGTHLLAVENDFSLDIRSTEKPDYSVDVNSIFGPNSKLKDSTFVSFNILMISYNCYAYALGFTDKFYYPGELSGYSILGYDLDNVHCMDALADMVKHDLTDVFGFSCVKIQNDCPTSVGIWENVIAARMETKYQKTNMNENDYHFAKLTSDGWYHKPGRTGILKFKNAPSNSKVWTNEAYDAQYYEPSTYYNTPLRFILYKRNHSDTTYTWTGTHYHSGASHFYRYSYVCDGCGYSNMVWQELPCTGPTCNLPWSVNPDPVTE
ncbi:MAG: hypothetical protein KH352_05175 [Ruminococcus sp.]|nr:hypothetical protein [Candidatus Apopatosoma intestinale]